MSEKPTAVICTQDLHKVYMMGENEVHALRGITLDVPRGQFLAVMGASGSGKSTFVNILGCLDRPTRGKYWLEGEDVSLLSADERAKVRKSRIGFVFQGFNLLQRTTALENVEMPLHYVRMSSRERRERARAMLDAVGLSDRSHHYPSQLSGGQQQRVAVARALINHPAIVLADEPTGNLDSRTAVEIMELLQRLNAERGITVILITHEDDIARFAGRQIVFRDGRLKSDHAVSSPAIASEVLRSRPAVEQEEP